MENKPERVEGEIAQDNEGNVVVGVPTAVAVVVIPTDEEDED